MCRVILSGLSIIRNFEIIKNYFYVRFNLFSILISSVCLISLFVAPSVGAKTLPPGYPERENIENLEEKFRCPPPGYGEVPFFWWIGDTLTREHLTWELDQLSGRHISSLQINYCHRDTGGLIYGLTYPSQPALFSDEWWSLFGWFMDEAGKRGMTVSLSDYTLGPGQGSYVDRMLEKNPSLNGYELHFDTLRVAEGEIVRRRYDELPLSLNAYRLNDGGCIDLGKRPYRLLEKAFGRDINWAAPCNVLLTEIKVVRKVPSINPMHPFSGRSYVNNFFQMFEDRFPGSPQKGLNFFFSDELNFALDGNIWSDNFRDEFRRRKAYDIVPVIDALFMDLGDMTPKIRLDYNDVRVSLSEEYFFKPIYDWHQKHGLIFGCDHGGRGRDVSEFGDYFRTQRWNQAPGCDQPFLQRDIVKNKVASSIAHLYDRQRVWLEGFHSSGWGTTSAQLTDAIFANFAMGHNLLSLHGLYYTTKGGLWEWAPPCNHFHEPYWVDMENLLECSERLSYILSQGYHVADIAVLYPVEPVVAGYGDRAVSTAFEAGEKLYRDGLDFDFIDYESLARATVKNGMLKVAGENYRVIVIPDMPAIRHLSLEKIREFAAHGGIVVNIGELPEATALEGRFGKTMKRVLDDIFHKGRPNVHRIAGAGKIVETVSSAIPRDFTVLEGACDGEFPCIMHRNIDGRDLYAVYNVARGALCRFRATGAPRLLDPYTGSSRSLEVVSVGGGATVIRMPLEASEMNLILFNPEEKAVIESRENPEEEMAFLDLDGEWSFTPEPVLDNSYGDYQWPGRPEMLGVCAYGATYCRLDGRGKALVEPRPQTFGYGEKFMLLAAPKMEMDYVMKHLPGESSPKAGGSEYLWQPYDFSWRRGVENDCGHQGWHGLKGEIDNDFIRLGKVEREFNGTVRKAQDAPVTDYYLYTCVEATAAGLYEVEWGGLKPEELRVNGKAASPAARISLEKGINRIVLHYDSHGTGRFVLRSGEPAFMADFEEERPLAMKYRGDASLLLFDTRDKAATKASFTFATPPGLAEMEFYAYGIPEVCVDTLVCTVTNLETRADGASLYIVSLPEMCREESVATITVPEIWGYCGGAVIDGPVKFTCGTGVYRLGDWCGNEALRTYSGAARYGKTFELGDKMPASAVLDLGEVVSSARVMVNGNDAGTRLAPPFRFDIAPWLRAGTNTVEVRVANTSANYYLTTPTTYGGSTVSGLIGPVRIIHTPL